MTASLTALTLATWNVLHRVHAENWGDAPLLAHPDERARVGAIAARIAARLAAGCHAVCLQEVSGDQLAALRAALPAGAQVFALRYPRVPRLRNATATALLDDPTEHLVTVLAASTPVARVAAREAFASDGGKGLLAVDTGAGFTVINTHVSFGDRRRAQLARLAQVGSAAPGTVVLAGDFNADRAAVGTALGEGWGVAPLCPDALPTRPRSDSAARSQNIDHVVARRGEAGEATVVSADGLSDHNLVVATVRGVTS